MFSAAFLSVIPPWMDSLAGPGRIGQPCKRADLRLLTFYCMQSHRCSGVGRCLAGFCKCPPMRWGMDCSRTQVWEPDPRSEAEKEGRAWNRCEGRRELVMGMGTSGLLSLILVM